MPTSPIDFVFETGTTTTDINGEAIVQFTCFKQNETPCVTLSTFDTTGNANTNLTDLSVIGTTWTGKIVTSAPNIKVHYRAISSTMGDMNTPNIVGQDLIEILTQNNNQIQIQIS